MHCRACVSNTHPSPTAKRQALPAREPEMKIFDTSEQHNLFQKHAVVQPENPVVKGFGPKASSSPMPRRDFVFRVALRLRDNLRDKLQILVIF